MSWRKINTTSKVTESSYADSIKGTNFMGTGTHQVTITGVELWGKDDKSPFVNFVFSNKEGATKEQRFFIESREWDHDGQQVLDESGKPKIVFNKKLLNLINNIAGDVPTGLKMLQAVESDPELFNQFVGLDLTILIGYPTKGFRIANSEEYAASVIQDIETGELVKDDNGQTVVAEDYKGIKAKAQELGIRLSYLGVIKTANNTELANANAEKLSAILQAGTGTTTTEADAPASIQGF